MDNSLSKYISKIGIILYMLLYISKADECIYVYRLSLDCFNFKN